MIKAYEIITNRILEKLKLGVVPWKCPWKVSRPKNLVTHREYRGVNVLLLAGTSYSSPNWATFKQIKAAGGSVNKGEKATPVVYWNWIAPNKNTNSKSTQNQKGDNSDTALKQNMVPFLKYYNVFNIEQTSGIEVQEDQEPKVLCPIDDCERLAGSMANPPSIAFDGGNKAFYRPSTDSVHLPVLSKFGSAEVYYSTLFHEIVHSTGHQKRLDRTGVKNISRFGSDQYSKEELVAEIGSAFLCGHAGIENSTIDNSAAYIDGWLKALDDDKKLVVVAAAQAQRAVDYVCSEKDSKPGPWPSRA